ncbi:MAG TPA: DNA alkylation repair protein [Chloroflexia bacterium]|nr:DNA alkylation repair protein [Chloroflexia bacterium]
MTDLQPIIARMQTVLHGFGPIKAEAQILVSANTTADSLAMAKELLDSPYYQARMLATFLLGMIAHVSPEAFALLLETVSDDPDWHVQEILAQAFDQYCTNEGYAPVLSVIRQWLEHTNPNVRRAAAEGPRIWTPRPYFSDNPQVAIAYLSPLRNDESEYVRKSVGNALRDISRKHPDLVRSELANWNLSDTRTAFTHKLAARFLV